MPKKPKTLSEKLLAALEGEKAEDILDDEIERPRTVGDDLDSDDETDIRNDKLSRLRTANLPSLSELDPRYSGKKVSRKDLDEEEHEEAELGHMFEIGSEDNDEQDSGEDEEDNELEEGGDLEFDEEDEFVSNEDEIEEQDCDDEGSVESEEEEDNEDLDDDDDDGDRDDHFANLDEDNDMEVDSSRLLFEKDDSEVEKGNHIRNQLIMYDKLLEMRIQLQKVLSSSMRFPKPGDSWNKHVREEDESTLEECREGLRHFLESSLKAKNELIQNNEDLRKRKLLDLESNGGAKRIKVLDFENVMSDRSSEFGIWRNEVLEKWNEKTRLVSSTSLTKTSSFSCFEVSVLKQIGNILSDKERLLGRTRVRRIEYDILGEEEWDEKEDPEIFDDGDFYHQLLRELISAKTAGVEDPNELGRQWLEVQKIRSKMKKKLAVDTKASKGRKIRYDIHAKLVNFMAPVYVESMNDEGKKELYSSLFGQRPCKGTVEP